MGNHQSAKARKAVKDQLPKENDIEEEKQSIKQIQNEDEPSDEESDKDSIDHIDLEGQIQEEDTVQDTESSDTDSSSEDSQDETAPVSYKIKLYCSSDESQSRTVKFVVSHTPRTVLDIKLSIEQQYSIPACCQQITFESQVLRDVDSIEKSRIREGDTLLVNYTTDAMVDDVRDIINAMKAMKRFLRRKTIRQRLGNGGDSYNDHEISSNLFARRVELLASAYFHPSADHRSGANRLFFVSNNGLQIMHQLHEELLRYMWKDCTLEMKYLEHAILRVLWNISAAFSIRMLLFERPTLEAVMKSLVRVEILPDRPIKSPRLGFSETRVTCEMLYKAVGTIGNLAEIPHCRVTIASSKAVLDQLLATLTSPTYNYMASLVAAAGLLCLSYSPETHKFLTTENVIDKFDRACQASKSHTDMDEQLLKYFRAMFYAQLLYASASKIPTGLKSKMHEAISSFPKSADYREIHEHEKKNGYIWSTVAPFVKLAYFPKHHPHWSFHNTEDPEEDKAFLEELEDLCIEAGVLSLQNMLLSDETRDILVNESLVDYVVCLPWHLQAGTQAHRRACDLRAFLGTKIQLQPPSLVNMTKAKLAVSHCGLKRVLKATSLHDIVNHIGH